MVRSANFFLLGCVGSALVSFTVSAACWSFPGKEAGIAGISGENRHAPGVLDVKASPLHPLSQVGPVLATCNGAFGMTSAALPLIFKLLLLGCSSRPTVMVILWSYI